MGHGNVPGIDEGENFTNYTQLGGRRRRRRTGRRTRSRKMRKTMNLGMKRRRRSRRH